jgi:hypothetical protein
VWGLRRGRDEALNQDTKGQGLRRGGRGLGTARS